jgi:hypothetical protein
LKPDLNIPCIPCCRRIAKSVGVLPMHAHAAQSGRAPGAEVQERHARLAAALALSELTQEKDIQVGGMRACVHLCMRTTADMV